jgi:hypothetical protein
MAAGYGSRSVVRIRRRSSAAISTRAALRDRIGCRGADARWRRSCRLNAYAGKTRLRGRLGLAGRSDGNGRRSCRSAIAAVAAAQGEAAPSAAITAVAAGRVGICFRRARGNGCRGRRSCRSAVAAEEEGIVVLAALAAISAGRRGFISGVP